MTERWLSVVGYEDHYEISDIGRVRSIRTNFGNRRSRVLKVRPTHDGYGYVELSRDNVQRKRKVHHLVLEAFVGPRPAGMLACHDDDDGMNNRLGNLRWDTPRSNYDDVVVSGAHKGSRHPAAKITEEVARKIKFASADKTRLARDIAAEFGATVAIVRNIRNGSSWSWL